MATSAYRRWVDNGRNWKPARPVERLASTLRSHGYVVYVLGNEQHQTTDAPEDHTVFSTTPWPGKHPAGYVLALDIMPPKRGQKSKVDGKPLPSLQALGRQIYTDKQAGVRSVAWVKYQNWEPERDWGGPCWHDSWQPNHRRRTSTDRGHIHISCRTDFHTSTVADRYDPVARLRPAATPQPAGDDMPLTNADKPTIASAVLGAGMGARGAQGSLHNWLQTWRAEARLHAEATLAAIRGESNDEILAKLDALAAELRERDEAEQARDAQLLALVQQGQDGTLDAAEVVQRIGELLVGQTGP